MSGCQEVSAAAELQGAHGNWELDQQGWPGSCSSRVVGQSVAQEVIVAIGTRGCSTSM